MTYIKHNVKKKQGIIGFSTFFNKKNYREDI